MVNASATHRPDAVEARTPGGDDRLVMAVGRNFRIPRRDDSGRRLTEAERRQELGLLRGFSDRQTHLDSDAKRVLRYEERPARGIVATYPSRISLCMNPGTAMQWMSGEQGGFKLGTVTRDSGNKLAVVLCRLGIACRT